MKIILYAICSVLFSSLAFAGGDEIANKIPLPTGLSKDTQFIIYYIDKRFEMMQREMDKRFEQVDKRFELMEQQIANLREEMNHRFEEVDKRFEQVDKRFEQIDKRFEQIDKRFEQIDKRFEQIDKRFDEVNKRFEMIIYLMMSIVAAFATIVAVAIGFAIWDRRTMTRPFEEKVKRLESDIVEDKAKLNRLIEALRKLAKTDQKVAEVLKTFSLL